MARAPPPPTPPPALDGEPRLSPASLLFAELAKVLRWKRGCREGAAASTRSAFNRMLWHKMLFVERVI